MEAIKRYVRKYGHSNKKGLQQAYAEVYTSALPVNVARIIAYRHNEAQKHKDASSFDELVTVLQTRLTEPPLNDMSIVPIIRQSDFEFAKVTKPCPDMPSAKNVEDVEKTVCAFLFFCAAMVLTMVFTFSVCFFTCCIFFLQDKKISQDYAALAFMVGGLNYKAPDKGKDFPELVKTLNHVVTARKGPQEKISNPMIKEHSGLNLTDVEAFYDFLKANPQTLMSSGIREWLKNRKLLRNASYIMDNPNVSTDLVHPSRSMSLSLSCYSYASLSCYSHCCIFSRRREKTCSPPYRT